MTGGMVEKAEIEVAYAALMKIKELMAGIDLSAETEADARLKLIDPILQQVLGWQPGQIKCEVSMDNTRLDYLLVAATGGAIVEAKRPALTFDLEAAAGGKRQYPLNGVVLRSGYTGECISQAKGYAQQHGINLAVATNGLQWVIFLASREDGVAPDKGFAFVFRSLDDILDPDRFREFYGLLSKQAVMSQSFKTAFYKAEGRLRVPGEVQATRLVAAMRGGDQRKRTSPIATALDPVIQQLFISMSPEREREIIRECFVTTKESQEADTRLQRLLDEVSEGIEKLDTRGSQDKRLQEEIEKGIEVPDSRTVVLIGQIGAGKSTYLDRFFSDVLSNELRKKVLRVTIDLEKARPDQETFAQFLRAETIRAIEIEAFGSEYPTFEDLKGAFFPLYQQLARGRAKPLSQAEQELLFANTLEEMKVSREEEYLRHLLAHCNGRLARLPVVIYDNVDHHSDELQTVTFQHSQWVGGLGRVFSILPVRDSTYWQASAEGPFHTHTHVSLYLPRPPLDQVLGRRFKYAELQIDELMAGKQVTLTSLHGIKVVGVEPKQLFQVLYKLFSRERYPNFLLRSLSGGNIREALMLFHQMITSPHIPFDKLIAAYLTQANYRLNLIDKSHFDKAVMLGSWGRFKQERSRLVTNLLCFPRILNVSPLLGMRILERLYDLRAEVHSRAGKGFETVRALLDYFEGMGVARGITEQCITEMVEKKLLEPYDISILTSQPQGITSDQLEFVCLSQSGRLHRYWTRDSRSYGMEMIFDMTIFDEDTASELQDLQLRRLEAWNKKDWGTSDALLSQIIEVSSKHLTQRDRDHVTVPALDPLFASQRLVTARLFDWSKRPILSETWSEEDE